LLVIVLKKTNELYLRRYDCAMSVHALHHYKKYTQITVTLD